MIRYELKKIFGGVGGKIALLLLVVTVVASCWSAVNGYGTSWVNEQGKEETGFAAARKLRAARKEWAGTLDTGLLTKAIQENQRIEATPEAQSNNDDLNNIAFGWKQGISDIRDVVYQFLSKEFQDYNYYLADSISLSRLPELYENRVRLLEDFIYGDPYNSAYNMFTDREKAWLIEQYEALETPMEYDYFLGWNRMAETSPTIIMLIFMILGYLVAGIFANEFKWRSDSIYFSTMLGKNVSIRAKIVTATVLISAVYWACMTAYSLFTLCYLGFDGWNCPVQLARWKCFYNVTFLEQYILILLGGYLGTLFSMFVVMWVSSKTRSSVVAVTVPFILIFLPNFFQNSEGTLLGDILGILPDRLLQINYSLNYFDVYTLGNKVIGSVPIMFALYTLLSLALAPVLYWEYKRKEII